MLSSFLVGLTEPLLSVHWLVSWFSNISQTPRLKEKWNRSATHPELSTNTAYSSGYTWSSLLYVNIDLPSTIFFPTSVTFFIGVDLQLIYSVVLMSATRQRDSVMYTLFLKYSFPEVFGLNVDFSIYFLWVFTPSQRPLILPSKWSFSLSFPSL